MCLLITNPLHPAPTTSTHFYDNNPSDQPSSLPQHSTSPVQTYGAHVAAVKAIAWSPHQHGLLASGGGTADRCIRFWNTLTAQPMHCVDTGTCCVSATARVTAVKAFKKLYNLNLPISENWKAINDVNAKGTKVNFSKILLQENENTVVCAFRIAIFDSPTMYLQQLLQICGPVYPVPVHPEQLLSLVIILPTIITVVLIQSLQ